MLIFLINKTTSMFIIFIWRFWKFWDLRPYLYTSINACSSNKLSTRRKVNAGNIMLVSINRCLASTLQIEDRNLVWIASNYYTRRVCDWSTETPCAIVFNIFKYILQFNTFFFKQILQKEHSNISSEINSAHKLLIITLYEL